MAGKRKGKGKQVKPKPKKRKAKSLPRKKTKRAAPGRAKAKKPKSAREPRPRKPKPKPRPRKPARKPPRRPVPKPPSKPKRPPSLPGGFKPVGGKPPKKRKPRPPGLGGPGRVQKRRPGEVAQQIRDLFSLWRERLFNDPAIVRALGLKGERSRFVVDRVVVPRSDGSVSASFDIDGIDKKLPIDRLLLALGMAMQGSAINGAWLSVGFRFPPSAEITSDVSYKKVHGKIQIRSHTRRFVKALVPYIMEQARELHERMVTTHRFRAIAIFVRVWWYPGGKRPRRTRTER